ncbi:T9SS type A sorting domain-containing protein [bacterium]|nr:T9SS type A sorting domain-containing protein [bacterium]
MKRYSIFIFLTLAMLICIMPVFGQITITSSDFPATIGQRHTIAYSTGSVTVDPGPSGANQTWDLRGTPAELTVELEVVARSATPNPSWIPDANWITRTTEDAQHHAFSYNQLTSNFAKALGMAYATPESSWVVEWTNEPPAFVFPIQYGNSWMSLITWEQSIGGITMYYADSTWYTVDGWGMVQVDGMNPVQCIRVKGHNHLVVTVMGFPAIDEWLWSYTWMAQGYPDLASMDSEIGADENFTIGYFSRASTGSAAEEPIQLIPLAFELQSPFPNPFNPETTIPYTVNQPTNVELSVFNTLGQKVRTLVNGQVAPGTHSIIWNGTDNAGNQVGAGVYYCRMINPEGTSASQKLTFVK